MINTKTLVIAEAGINHNGKVSNALKLINIAKHSNADFVKFQIFDTEQLSRIIKIAGLGTSLQIYPKTDLPLLLKSGVGTLGTIAIYIKTKKQIEEDEFKADDSDEDE